MSDSDTNYLNVYLIERHLIAQGDDASYESGTLISSVPYGVEQVKLAIAWTVEHNHARNPLTQGIYVIRTEAQPGSSYPKRAVSEFSVDSQDETG